MAPRARQAAAELTRVYRSLSPQARRAVWVLLAFEAVLISATERDIQRRATNRIWGPKLLWRVVATQNVIGPAVYLLVGRRRGR